MTPRRRWLDEALDLLATSSFNGVTIEALYERLGLSKGSFYHHFKGIPGYRIALLEHFEEREIQAFIDLVEALPTTDGADRLRALTDAVAADEAHDALEPQVRIWAARTRSRESVSSASTAGAPNISSANAGPSSTTSTWPTTWRG